MPCRHFTIFAVWHVKRLPTGPRERVPAPMDQGRISLLRASEPLLALL
jgi:hypothetical protein